MSRPRGVSAPELLLVIAATLAVGAIVVAMLRTHYARHQVTASVEEAAAAQRLVVAAYRARGTPPQDAAATGIDGATHELLAGPYLDALEVHNGRLDLRFGSAAGGAIAGKVLSLTPFETADRQVVWLCGNETPDVGLQPLGFAAGGPQPVHVATSIEDRYLPPRCR